MSPFDLVRLALLGLARNRARTLMTLLGVSVGAMALLTLLAYGSGLRRNARAQFEALELYNTLRVTSQPSPFDTPEDFLYRSLESDSDSNRPVVPLTDSLAAVLSRIPGVLAVYPEVQFPVRLQANGREIAGGVEAVPLAFARLPSYRPRWGGFFTGPADTAILISASMAERLGFARPEEAIGKRVRMLTATLDWGALQRALWGGLGFFSGELPIRIVSYSVRIRGVWDAAGQPIAGVFRVVMPLEVARGMQKLTFFSTVDLLLRRAGASGYSALRVQLADMRAHDAVRRAIASHGVYVSSFREQFAELDRLFWLVDLALFVIGAIALLVASLGIANTMSMNVLERFREIGMLKALGAYESDIQRLFLLESALLGLLGGLVGWLLGWAIAEVINALANYYLGRHGIPYVEFFHITPQMLLGVALLTLLVGLVAGWWPARRAGRVDVLVALRHV
ncbi:MAG: ABC transporter permease [Bacteroidetes bacterium]|nr:ABC transporter permease [Bacteroidota bacterium]MCX7906497.1 ABC transporter permease [Bacteroidota bacterium]MDW8137222.1 FtsX-like permease family protein [Bacteroidota bacterium]